MLKALNRKQAIDKARNHSKTKNANENRVYVFESLVTNQYFKAGEYYTQAVGDERSFNIGEKNIIAVYQHGKKIR